ncbi:hypothetical protein BC827DRAFT_637623 [Russula dissimulans]|nr:hypothetical protein BC827DRAFT_637623 [Russula dissimulans]
MGVTVQGELSRANNDATSGHETVKSDLPMAAEMMTGKHAYRLARPPARVRVSTRTLTSQPGSKTGACSPHRWGYLVLVDIWAHTLPSPHHRPIIKHTHVPACPPRAVGFDHDVRTVAAMRTAMGHPATSPPHSRSSRGGSVLSTMSLPCPITSEKTPTFNNGPTASAVRPITPSPSM